MTVYLFDADKRVRKIIPPNGLMELIHDEAAYILYATVGMEYGVVNGEHIGFRCIDGKFRIFTVTKSENKDDNRTTIITATDAIVQELREIIVEDHQQLDVTLVDAIKGLLEAAGTQDAWTVAGAQPDRTEKSRAYYATIWAMLESYMALYEWQIIPYYTFFGGSISGRVIELKEDKAEFRGRILTSKKDASNVYVIKNNPPYTRLYGIGPATGSGDLQTNMTFADVSWSISSGNPADKPKGQAWVEDPEAVAKYRLHTAVVQINEAEDAEQLLEKTWQELQRIKEPSCTVEATVQDLEKVPGYENQVIRLGDLVPIRLSNATMETARVIGIKRNYLQHWLTKIVIGDKEATIQSQVSSLIAGAAHTFERLTIYKNRFKEDEALIQLNAEFVQANAEAIELNAKEIRANAELIGLKAEKSEVTEMGTRIGQAELLIDALDARIDLLATESSIEELATRVSRAEIDINGAEADIALKADQTIVDDMGERLSQAEVDIDGANAAIALKANKSTVDGLETQTAELQVKYDQISTKVEDNEGNLSSLTQTVNGFNTRVKDAEDNISTLTQTSTQFRTRLENTEGDISTLTNTVDGLASDVADTAGNISTLTNTVNGLTNRVEDAEGNITTLQTTSSGFETRVANAEGIVAALSVTVSEQGSKIDAQAQQISLKASTAVTDALSYGLSDAETAIKEAENAINDANAEIAKKASQDDLDAVMIRLDSAEDSITLQAGEISLKANKTYVDDLVAEFITAEALESSIADIQDAYATQITTNMMSAATAEAYELSVAETAWITELTAGSLTSGSLVVGEVDFATHSHKITANGDGTVTLGEVSSTGGSFNIADTQYYKDGVSAAYPSYVSYVAQYLSTSRTYDLTATVTSANGHVRTFDLAPIDATGPYNGGRDAGIIVGYGRAQNDCALSISGTTVAATWADGTSKEIDATPVYNTGWNDCRSNATPWKALVNYYPVGETLYDAYGNVAVGPWYKGTETYLYALPAAKS